MLTRYDPKASENGGSGGSGRETTYLNSDFGRLIKVVHPDIGTWISNYDLGPDKGLRLVVGRRDVGVDGGLQFVG